MSEYGIYGLATPTWVIPDAIDRQRLLATAQIVLHWYKAKGHRHTPNFMFTTQQLVEQGQLSQENASTLVDAVTASLRVNKNWGFDDYCAGYGATLTRYQGYELRKKWLKELIAQLKGKAK